MAIPEFFLAWIDEPVAFNEVTHAVKDEQIIWLNRVFAENDFPNLSVQVEKPSDELLAITRKRWAWVSYRKMNGTIVPLYLGWLVGLPEDMVQNIITITFTSRPSDFAQQKEALASTRRELPELDLAFIKPEMRGDPDIILQGRPMAWHINHLYPLTVSLSHLVSGEDGHVNFDSGTQVSYDSVTRSLRSVPIRKAKFTAEANWLQSANGVVDLKVPILQAAKAAGTTVDGVVTSYTGQGLADDWPENDDNIGSGWRVKAGIAEFVKQEELIVSLPEVPITYEFTGHPNDPMLNALRSMEGVPGDAIFYLWHLRPTFIAQYEVNRRRTEVLTFELEGDIQPILTEPGDEEIEEMSASAIDLVELIDEGGTLAPIRDARRSEYFTTERGKKSVEFLMNVAGSQIIARARCAEVEFKVPFEDGIDPTCRMTATLNDPRFPGGATGKIVGSSLLADPNGGEFSCTFLIACSVGEGNVVTPELGTPLYIEDAYIDESYYEREGQTFTAVESNLTYGEFVTVTSNDDGINFFDMSWQQVVLSCILVNGQTAQEAVLTGGDFTTIDEAVDALVEVFSEYQLVLKPLEGTLETEYTVPTSGLMISKTIDLRAVG